MLKFISRLFSKNKKEDKSYLKPAVMNNKEPNNHYNQSNSYNDQDNEDFLAPTVKPANFALTPKPTLENNHEVLKSMLSAGNEALGKGLLDQAENYYREAMNANEDSLAARINLAWVLTIKTPIQETNLEEAKMHLLKGLEIDSNHIDVNFILSQVYEKLHDIDHAVMSYMATLKLKPEFEMARNELYNLALKHNKANVMIDFLEGEIKNYPERKNLYFDLGNFYNELENYSSAIESYQEYLKHDSRSSATYNNLGAVYFKAKNPELAVENYKKAIQLGDSQLQIESTNQLLYTMNYIPGLSLSDYHDQAIKYGKLLTEKYVQYTSWKEQEGKLKVGFVSGDLKYHPVAYFLSNLIKNYNRKKFEFIVYSTSIVEDDMTNDMKKYINQWKVIDVQNPVECAKQIHDDGINILIDLAGHSHASFAKNLDIFAMKPAPVQASWLGYFNSTGVEQMDYIILDNYCIEKEEYQYMTEKVIALPETRLNYCPPEDNVQYPTVTPAMTNGFITFGCFQSLLKINAEVLSTWAEILDKVPHAKLRIQEKSLSNVFVRHEFMSELKIHGLDDKVILVEGEDHKEYLNSYSQVDIILDTFPFTGGTTTCEALWMGIPTITLNGNTIIGRQSASFLKELNMNQWIAQTKEEYIEKAVSFSADIYGLNGLRQKLRKELIESSICDSINFPIDFEEILDEMWKNK